jgi:hypothetical protein
MAGLRDLFDKGKGVFNRGMEIMKEKSSDLFDRVHGKSSPVRDAEPKVNASVETPEARQARMANEMNSRQSAKAAAEGKPLSKPHFRGPHAVERNIPPGISASNPNVNLRAGKASPEAQAFRSAGGGRASPPPSAPKPGMLRGAATTLGRVAGPLAAASGVPDQLQNGATDMDDRIAQELSPNVGLAKLPGAPQLGESETNALRALHGNIISLGRRTGNALSFGANAGDKIVGGIRDIAQGNPLGTTQFGENAQAAVRGAAVTPNNLDAELRAGAPGAPGDVQVPAAERPLDPGAMLRDSSTPIPEGTGAFQRTTPGNVGKPQLVDSRPAMLRDQQAQVEASQRQVGPAGMLGGYIARLAKLKGEQAAQSQANFEGGMNVKRGRLAVAAHQQALADRTAREKGVADEIRNEVIRDSSGDLAGKTKEDRESVTNQRAADVSQRYVRSAASQGKQLGDLSTVETSQLRALEQFRKGLGAQRPSFDNFLRSFTGNKQFDHENLYDYAPEGVDDSSAMGPVLIMRGGNKVRLEKSGVRAGETHWFSPNDPLKTDLTALVEFARKNKKGSK